VSYKFVYLSLDQLIAVAQPPRGVLFLSWRTLSSGSTARVGNQINKNFVAVMLFPSF